MHPFTLSKAIDPASAISAAQDPHLVFIAGGTDLIGLMKDRAALPERLLDINGLPDMDHVSVAPAIANAVYHATGKRVRDLPITIEKLL